MKKVSGKNLISGRIDDMGRLLLPSLQMKALNFNEGEEVSLDFDDEGIIIAKSLGYSIAYDRIKAMPNGILIGRDICRSKLLINEDKRIIENAKIKVYEKNDAYLNEDKPPVIHYEVKYYIDTDRIIIPLTNEQRQAELRVIRTVDELGRILIPNYLRNIHNLKTKTGIGIKEHSIIISNDIKRKTTVDELGRIVIPKDILEFLKLEPKIELEVEASGHIILSALKTLT